MPKAKKPVQLTVNLVPQDPFYETPIGKTLKWALSVGRYIVIFTELIVILSFVGRFSLDRTVTDLNSEINQKQNRIESLGDIETSVRDVQSKIEQYNQIKQRTNLADVFPQMSQITPRDVKLTQLTIEPDGVTFAGSVLSQSSLNLLVTNIQLSPFFREVTINHIETGDEQEPGFHFQVSAKTSEAIETTAQNQPNQTLESEVDSGEL